MRRALFYGAALIGVYLAVSYATGFGRDLTAGKDFGVGVIRAFQGR
jgi:hypothetical protein